MQELFCRRFDLRGATGRKLTGHVTLWRISSTWGKLFLSVSFVDVDNLDDVASFTLNSKDHDTLQDNMAVVSTALALLCYADLPHSMVFDGNSLSGFAEDFAQSGEDAFSSWEINPPSDARIQKIEMVQQTFHNDLREFFERGVDKLIEAARKSWGGACNDDF